MGFCWAGLEDGYRQSWQFGIPLVVSILKEKPVKPCDLGRLANKGFGSFFLVVDHNHVYVSHVKLR